MNKIIIRINYNGERVLVVRSTIEDYISSIETVLEAIKGTK